MSLCVLVPVFGNVAAAAPGTTTTAETTITVRSGDSLAGIAWRYGVRLSALLRANSLKPASVIHPGQTLVLPAGATVRGTNAPAHTTVSTANGAATTRARTATTGTDYVVRTGDALAGIAWRHGVSLDALLKTNDLRVTSVIHPGRVLRIPPGSRPTPTSAGSGGSVTTTRTATPATAVAPHRPSVPSTPGSSTQRLLAHATAQVGKPYRFFSAGPDSFDCSGLVVAAFRKIGVNVPHQSRALARLGTPVDWRSTPIAAGDLVFTSAVGDPALITHVGIALDSRRWIHAVGVGRTVTIAALPTNGKIMAVRRITTN